MTAVSELCLLVDNGSIRDHAALFTRKLASTLACQSGKSVMAVSLAHSDRIPLAKLNGEAVPLLLPTLHSLEGATSLTRLRVLPLLMVGEGIIYRKIASAAATFANRRPDVDVSMAPALVDPCERGEGSIPHLMASAVMRIIRERSLRGAEVIIVDHGSPVEAVARLRDWVADEVRRQLPEGIAARVVAASMERREGEAFAFADPLLEAALADAARRGVSDVVVAKMLLQPGKHSGRRGDIETILERVSNEHASLAVHQPRQIFRQNDLISLLLRRLTAVAIG